MPQVLAAELKTGGHGAINRAAISRAMQESTISVHPEIGLTTIRAADCSIRHRTTTHRTTTITTTWIWIPMTSTVTAATVATTPDRCCKSETAASSSGRFDAV